MDNQKEINENVEKMLKSLSDDLGKNFDKEKHMKSTFSVVRNEDDLTIEKEININLESISIERLTESLIELTSKKDFTEIAVGSLREKFVKSVILRDNRQKISELLKNENLGPNYALSIIKTVSSLGIDKSEEILSLLRFLPFVVTLLNNFKALDSIPSAITSRIISDLEKEGKFD